MNPAENPPLPKPGTTVPTACRGTIHYEPATPSVVYSGQRFYFCLPGCLKAFQENPQTSCLAGHPILGQQ